MELNLLCTSNNVDCDSLHFSELEWNNNGYIMSELELLNEN